MKEKSLRKKEINYEKVLNWVTIGLFILVMMIYEILFCNGGWIQDKINNIGEIHYNISIFRIIVYIVFAILYIKFSGKFIECAIQTLKQKYKKIALYIYIPISLIIIIYTFLNWTAMYRVALVLITCIMGAIMIIYISKDYIKNIIVTTLTVGMVFCFSTQFNGAMDEKKHFMSAYNLSIGNINFVKKPLTQDSIEQIPRICALEASMELFKQKATGEIYENTNKKDIDSLPADYNFMLYVPGGVGIFLAKTLGGSIADMYIAGRVANLLVYAIFLIAILKILPYKKKIFYIIYMLPFIVLQASSYSIDGLCIGTVGLFIAYCLKLYNEDYKKIGIKQIVILATLFSISLIAKNFAYIGIGFLVFILPIIKILKNNKKNAVKLGALIAIIGIIFAAIYIFKPKIESDPRGGQTSVEGQIEFLVSEPKNIMEVGINHISETLININWLSVIQPEAFFGKFAKQIFILEFIFIVYVMLTDNTKNFKPRTKVVSIISFLLVFISTSAILYLIYSEVGTIAINGYQTRYIAPVLPIILMLFNLKIKDKFQNEECVALVSGLLTTVSLIGLIAIV